MAATTPALDPETRRAYRQRLRQVERQIQAIDTILDNLDLLCDARYCLDDRSATLEQSWDVLRDLHDGLEAERGILEEFLAEP
jgi:hypothetical protein